MRFDIYKKKFHLTSDDAAVVFGRHLTLEIGISLMMAISEYTKWVSVGLE